MNFSNFITEGTAGTQKYAMYALQDANLQNIADKYAKKPVKVKIGLSENGRQVEVLLEPKPGQNDFNEIAPKLKDEIVKVLKKENLRGNVDSSGNPITVWVR